MKKQITYIVNTSEITAGTRGASLGPGAVMAAARTNNNTLFGKYPLVDVGNVNFYLDRPVIHPFAKRAEGLIEIYDRISKAVSGVLNEGRFPLVLAGDHGSAGGTIAGIKTVAPEKRLGVIWIDAHGDIHTPYTTPSGNMHGMPLATALYEDNLECKRNDVPAETVALWEKLKNTGYAGQKLAAEDLAFIGVRDTEEEEEQVIDRLRIRNYTVDEVRTKGTEEVCAAIDQQLKDCDVLYVSFDVDSMDPKETSYGTGTPVENGLMKEEARRLLRHFAAHPKLVCMEFVEINPCLDERRNRMAEIAFELWQDVVTVLENN